MDSSSRMQQSNNLQCAMQPRNSVSVYPYALSESEIKFKTLYQRA
ncbi:hypothetical protein GCM10008018_57700 [Paenibacillus marchantiophytorum]|uniref:Uncharacterized protein n=1 Tax=Paenibacillus marchantiophytorum TaxID=1619310 RepID=A0ABQ1FB76_9BACL|nr:hypothetical protein GCM10008018_57700 [Paenibacillus marchantiophytorum]